MRERGGGRKDVRVRSGEGKGEWNMILAIDVPFLIRPSCAACQKYVPWLIAATSDGAPPKTCGFQLSASQKKNWVNCHKTHESVERQNKVKDNI